MKIKIKCFKTMDEINKFCEENYKDLINEKDILTKSLTRSSSKKRIDLFRSKLEGDENNTYDEEQINSLISLMLKDFIISPQSLANIRGNTFNKIVEDELKGMKHIQSLKFEIYTKYSEERVDWIIEHCGKVIIGMNQIDLWTGGAQLNRAGKYILSNKQDCECFTLSVIHKDGRINLTKKNKQFRILSKGIKDKSLCYVNNLKDTINSILEIDKQEKNI